jgi:hypothetical protein
MERLLQTPATEDTMMKGTITKRDIIEIWKVFGFVKAIRILFSTDETALRILVS